MIRKRNINMYEQPCVKKFIVRKKSPTEEATGIGYGSRILLIGGSNSGKTNALYNFLLLSPNTFCKVIVVSKEIEEPLYTNACHFLG